MPEPTHTHIFQTDNLASLPEPIRLIVLSELTSQLRKQLNVLLTPENLDFFAKSMRESDASSLEPEGPRMLIGFLQEVKTFRARVLEMETACRSESEGIQS
jgi:hypothetical protein